MKYEWNLNKIKEYVKTSINLSEVLDKLEIPRQGNNSKTLRNILDKNQIDYSHFTGRARTYTTKEIPIEEYLSNAKSISTHSLKSKLLSSGLKLNQCECCGISEWRGKQLTIQLHHIDGNNKNNSLENLQMLCPNCHSLTENYCGNANKIKEKFYCPDCGKEIGKNSTYCSVCSATHARKVERPKKEELYSTLKNTPNFTKVGKLYGVTDNTIRKWCRYYDLSDKIIDYK